MHDQFQDDPDLTDTGMEAIQAQRDGLQPGGPDVDYVVLIAYVERMLPEPRRQAVERAIATWRSWYDAWLDIQLASDPSAEPVLRLEPAAQTTVPLDADRGQPMQRGGQPMQSGGQLVQRGGQLVQRGGQPMQQGGRFLPRERAVVVGSLVGLAAAFLAALLVAPPSVTRGPQVAAHSVLTDGPLQITAQGALVSAEAFPEELRQAAALAWQSGGLTLPPSSVDLIGSMERQRSGTAESPALRVLKPVGTRVEQQQPVFTWQAIRDATGYRVSLFDDFQNQVAASELLADTRWVPPETLPRGKQYLWQVTAEVDGQRVVAPAPPQPPAMFEVLSVEQQDRLDARRRSLPDSRLLHAALYAEFGLLDDAQRELESLVAANPESLQSRALLDDLRRRRNPVLTVPQDAGNPNGLHQDQSEMRMESKFKDRFADTLLAQFHGQFVALLDEPPPSGQTETSGASPDSKRTDVPEAVQRQLRQLVADYYRTYAEQNDEAHFALWSPMAQGLEQWRSDLRLRWSLIRSEFPDVKVVSLAVDKSTATLLVRVETRRTDASGNQTRLTQFDRFQLELQQDAWKIVTYQQAERLLAEKLLAARDDRERDALLTQSPELLNIRLCDLLLEFGNSHYFGRRFDQAEAAFNLQESLSGRIDYAAGRVLAWQGMGNVADGRERPEQALQWYEKGLRLAREIDDHGLVAGLLNNMATIHDLHARPAQAVPLYQQSLEAARRVNDLETQQFALGNLGGAYGKLGNYDEAVRCLEGALTLLDAPAPASRDHRAIGRTWFQLGTVHRRRFDARSAALCFENARQFSRKAKDEVAEIAANNGLGAIYFWQGNDPLAIQTFGKVLDGYRKLGFTRGVATAQYNLANVYGSQREYDKALSHLQQSIELTAKLDNPQMMANRLCVLGNIQRVQGKFEAARQSLLKSLEVAEGCGYVSGQASARRSLARLELGAGQPLRALKLARQAIDAAQSDEALETLRRSQFVAALACVQLKRTEEAQDLLIQSIATLEQIRATAIGDEMDMQTFLESRLEPVYLLTDLLVQQGRFAEALSWAERGKARVLSDLLRPGRQRAERVVTDAEHEQEQQLQRQVAESHHQLFEAGDRSPKDSEQIERLEHELAERRLQLNAFRTRLFSRYPSLKVQRGDVQTIKMADLAALLPNSGSGLLQFVTSEQHCDLFVVLLDGSQQSPTVAVHHHRIPITHADLRKHVRTFLAQIQSRDLEVANTASQLYELLLAPADEHLAGLKHLRIVPDGALWELPFQVLQTGKRRYVLQDYVVSYASSFAVLREMQRDTRESRATATIRVLACGAPSLPDRIPKLDPLGQRDSTLRPLPNARREIEQLSRLYPPDQCTLYVGKDAQELRIQQEAGAYGVLHFATHGVVDDASPMYSFLLLAPSDTQRDLATSSDGFLEAWELMRMNLGAELAVLSACETARGRLASGEGVIGLSWALFAAGCPSAVVSQWKVDSASTADMMIQFHRELRESRMRDKAAALRKAQLSLLDQPRFRHPYYWGGFVLVGADRHP